MTVTVVLAPLKKYRNFQNKDTYTFTGIFIIEIRSISPGHKLNCTTTSWYKIAQSKTDCT